MTGSRFKLCRYRYHERTRYSIQTGGGDGDGVVWWTGTRKATVLRRLRSFVAHYGRRAS